MGGGKLEWVSKQPGTRVDEDRTTQRERFQVSRRDSGKRGVDKGNQQGELARRIHKGLRMA